MVKVSAFKCVARRCSLSHITIRSGFSRTSATPYNHDSIAAFATSPSAKQWSI